MSQSLSVLLFNDYRAYLTAHIQQMRIKNPLWSVGAWARRLGLGGTSSLSKIITGERHPGETICLKLVDYFNFDVEEEQHFRDLVRLQKLSRRPEMGDLLNKLNQSRGRDEAHKVDEATFAVLSEWYCYAIREMTNLKDFSEDPDWIANHLKFPPSRLDVRKALARLIQTGLLKRNAKGKLVLGYPNISTSNDVASEAIRRYHSQSLENIKTALQTIPPTEREVTSTTFAIAESDLPKAKEMLRRFKKSFSKTLESTNADRVYHLELAFIPVTEKRGEAR